MKVQFQYVRIGDAFKAGDDKTYTKANDNYGQRVATGVHRRFKATDMVDYSITPSTANEYGGEDFIGAHGVARWVKDDTDTVVYSFDTKMVLRWDCRFSGTTPPSVVSAAYATAVGFANFGSTNER